MSSMPNSNPVDLRSLPYRTRLVAEKIGLNETYFFFEKFAHRTLYVPPNLKQSDLATKIGEAAAIALVELWPNSHFTPPKIDKMFQQWRNYELMFDVDEDKLSIVEMCIKYNLTRQRINQIRHEHAQKHQEDHKLTNQNLTLDLNL